MTHRGTLRMADPGMNVIHSIGHGPDQGQLWGHQPFADHTPVTEIGG